MRTGIALSCICILAGKVCADELPILVCQTLEEVTVTHSESFPTRHSKTPDLYRIADGNLYMSSPGSDEYLYGELIEADWLRYTSGFKTIIFLTDKYDNATEVHTDSQGTRVRRLHCTHM